MDPFLRVEKRPKNAVFDTFTWTVETLMILVIKVSSTFCCWCRSRSLQSWVFAQLSWEISRGVSRRDAEPFLSRVRSTPSESSGCSLWVWDEHRLTRTANRAKRRAGAEWAGGKNFREGIFAAHAHRSRSGTSDGVRVSYEKKVRIDASESVEWNAALSKKFFDMMGSSSTRVCTCDGFEFTHACVLWVHKNFTRSVWWARERSVNIKNFFDDVGYEHETRRVMLGSSWDSQSLVSL